VVQAVAAANPEAILNVTFGRLPRQARARGQHPRRLQGCKVVSFLTAAEYLDPLKDETPEGWIVTGYSLVLDQDAGA